MPDRVHYESLEGVGWIRIDDGKVNALSPALQAEISAALVAAEENAGPTVLCGREGIFSAGFDLEVLRSSPEEAANMVIGGFELAARVLAHPRPTLVGCSGHAIAMGAFLLLAGDYRLGLSTSKVWANEVAIGLTLPHSAIELLRQRLIAPAFQRASILAEPFVGDAAVGAGFLDAVVAPEAFEQQLGALAQAMLALDAGAHQGTKARVRRPQLDALRAALDRDRQDLGL